MKPFLAATLFLLVLSGCVVVTSSSHTPVEFACATPPELSEDEAIEDFASFMSTRGYSFLGSGSFEHEGRPYVRARFDGGADTVASIDNLTSPRSFTLTIMVKEGTTDFADASALVTAFVSHYSNATGWKVQPDTSCYVAP